METTTAYHGTGSLEDILNDGAVFCFDLAQRVDEVGERVYDLNIKEYEELTAKLASVMRDKRREQGKNFPVEWYFQMAGNSNEALADLAVLYGYVKLDGLYYKESIRKTHVFLNDYEIAKNYADKGFKAIFEFEIPNDLVRPRPFSRNTLVRKKVDLQYLKRLYVDELHVGQARGLLELYGYNGVEVGVIK